MAWALEFTPAAANDMKKLGRGVAARIVKTLETRIASREDPTTLARSLKGDHDGYWRWRIGSYRVIGRVNRKKVTILIVHVGHRNSVYR
jgi:mRNA interferase RelE/StbE